MRVLVFTVVATLLAVGSPAAVCLVDDYSVEAEFQRSPVVAIARVISERQVPEERGSGALDGTLYTLRIQESFRGQARGRLAVFSENSSGRFPMEKGGTYIVFLYDQGGRLSADNCGNSGVVSER
jgi:hypothetical protein